MNTCGGVARGGRSLGSSDPTYNEYWKPEGASLLAVCFDALHAAHTQTAARKMACFMIEGI
jgi:hypothetical protein